MPSMRPRIRASPIDPFSCQPRTIGHTLAVLRRDHLVEAGAREYLERPEDVRICPYSREERIRQRDLRAIHQQIADPPLLEPARERRGRAGPGGDQRLT